ncbi:MAG TPA: beta-L-arabinofuranosidase domain-containing protein [Acidimicrobiales bacterium]|nr:beta-L-arabinofuranosidase domain-containing protein [Acidimicrobiales bacterium]
MTAGPVVPVSGRVLELQPLVHGSVELAGGFWGHRQRQNREVTIPYAMSMLEETGTLENLRLAAGASSAAYRLPLFRDSDLYKVLEAIAWERARGADPDQERFFASSVGVIEAAQEPDGYVNSYVQVVEKGRRFGDPAMGHELYCAGHLVQAAVADLRSAGAPTALGEVAGRLASLLVGAKRTDEIAFVPGHPEIETALVELYRTVGRHELLDLAAELIARRGRKSLHWHMFQPPYFQDDVPFVESRTVRGHAVRALYLLAGATDVYTETGRPELLGAIEAQWQDMVSGKTYLTGGLGARHEGESFGDRFELPPDRAYCETCAAIASVMWNWRMLLITGEARFADLMERTLYNGFIGGVGLDGTSFYYENPLQSRQPTARAPWYDCACCPPNAMRLLASLQHYLTTATAGGVQLHHYAPSTQRIDAPAGSLELAVETGYPYSGAVSVRVLAAPPGELEIAARIPPWAGDVSGTLNGASLPAEPGTDRYLRLRRPWSAGEEIVLELELRPRTVRALDEIDAVRGCVAFERGPLVYCIEGRDIPGGANLRGVAVRAGSPAGDGPSLDVGGQVVPTLVLDGCVSEAVGDTEGWPYDEPTGGAAEVSPAVREGGVRAAELLAVPFFARANRGATDLRVWVPELG